MKTARLMVTTAVTVATAATVALAGCAAPPVETGHRLSEAYAPGPFAVGVAPNFVKDFSRPFDAWGAQYKSDAYRALLAAIDASGEPATVATQIYYPSPPAGERVARRAGLHPSALWAARAGACHCSATPPAKRSTFWRGQKTPAATSSCRIRCATTSSPRGSTGN